MVSLARALLVLVIEYIESSHSVASSDYVMDSVIRSSSFPA